MRRNAPLIVMLSFQAGVLAMAILFHLRSRPSILKAFADFGTALPPTAALALSGWFLPSAVVLGVVTALGAFAPLKRSKKNFVVGLGLTISCSALMFAVTAAFLPIFQPT